MKPQLIIDCGGRVLSALLVTADGQLVPCSQEIRQVATRHVPSGVLFEPRVSEDPDFLWEDALEALAKAAPQNFFQRARRIGIRRPWDPQASPDALQLAPPLAVLSSAAAVADRVAGGALPTVGAALLDALLDPTFAFLAARQLAFAGVEPFIIVPAQTGRRARIVLQKLFRRRGFPPPAIVRRELAAAMSTDSECVVVDASGDELHLHRVVVDSNGGTRRVHTVASATVRDFGWSHWRSCIAAALQTTPSSAFDRALTALLTGASESRVTHGALQAVLDENWIEVQRRDAAARLRAPLESIGAAGLPRVFAGELFALDAMCRVFEGRTDVPVLEHALRGVASTLLWLRGDDARRLVLASAASLRIDTFHGDAVELVPPAQLPAPGAACHIETAFRFAGERAGEQSFLVHLMWGADSVPEGNATLCAVPLDVRGGREDELRVALHLRRSRGGSRLYGSVEARLAGSGPAARTRFAEELEVRR